MSKVLFFYCLEWNVNDWRLPENLVGFKLMNSYILWEWCSIYFDNICFYECKCCQKIWKVQGQFGKLPSIARYARRGGALKVCLRRAVALEGSCFGLSFYLRLDKMTTTIKPPLRGHSLIFVTQFYIIFDPLTLSRLGKCNTTSFTRKLTMCKKCLFTYLPQKNFYIRFCYLLHTNLH